jgi:2-methylisocitrate lyase-like PEP mutase family enzyme
MGDRHAQALAFRALHRADQPLRLLNAWDAGSAKVLAAAGAPALGTTSAGVAFALGLPDGERLSRDGMLAGVRAIADAVAVPVSADLEAGYGDSPADVGRTVARAAGLGIAGANIEDAQDGRLFGIEEAVQRLAAARAAARPGTFVLNARTDTYLGSVAGDPFEETVERARRYVSAGADCIFVPGVNDEETIRRLADAIPAPLNVVAGLASNVIPAHTLFGLGVSRVSVGGSIARAALSLVERAGRELKESGTLGFLDGALGYAEMQRRFGA